MTKHFLVQEHVQRLLGIKILINAPAETNPYLFSIIGTHLSKGASSDTLLALFFLSWSNTFQLLGAVHVVLLHTLI